MPPLVSFIVVNWNGRSCIEECLSSIQQQSYKAYEIIVVDNASTDGSLQLLRQYPGISLIENQANLGFGAANNKAFARSAGEIVALINNDTKLAPDWLKNLIVPLIVNPNTGMCAGKTLSYDRREVIDNTGHLLYWDGMNRGRGRMQKDRGQFDRETEAFFPSGCACLFRSEMLKQIGFFDEDFYLYGDDTELGIRARLAGWECSFVPAAIAYHHGSASLSYYHASKFFYVERNRMWVAIKYFPIELLLLNPFFSALRYLSHLIALAAGKGVTGAFAKEQSGPGLLRVWMQAQISAWKGARGAWRKRREYFAKFHWTRKRFYRCFFSHRLSLRELTFTP